MKIIFGASQDKDSNFFCTKTTFEVENINDESHTLIYNDIKDEQLNLKNKIEKVKNKSIKKMKLNNHFVEQKNTKQTFTTFLSLFITHLTPSLLHPSAHHLLPPLTHLSPSYINNRLKMIGTVMQVKSCCSFSR